MSNAPLPQEIREGTVWRVRSTGERWEVLEARYDGPGTYRVALLDRDGVRTAKRDTVWGAELWADAELIGVATDGYVVVTG